MRCSVCFLFLERDEGEDGKKQSCVRTGFVYQLFTYKANQKTIKYQQNARLIYHLFPPFFSFSFSFF